MTVTMTYDLTSDHTTASEQGTSGRMRESPIFWSPSDSKKQNCNLKIDPKIDRRAGRSWVMEIYYRFPYRMAMGDLE
jgi:hypothetical protein